MTATLTLLRAGPLTTIQDDGRFGMLAHGISASGPMDRSAFARAGDLAGGGRGGVEFTLAGLELRVASGTCRVGMAGGNFTAHHNDRSLPWPGSVMLEAGDTLAVTPGSWGNYGYLRFAADMEVPLTMGSIATNSRTRLGGLAGRALRAGDVLELTGAGRAPATPLQDEPSQGPIRVIWGLHAERFAASVRQRFVEDEFVVSSRLDRMGVRLEDSHGVFAGATILSLVSDAVVPGDIQILGDGAPIVLMRDHQPTGGYPRIATVVSADLDRFAQMRPGSAVTFLPITVDHAHRLLRSRSR